MTRMTTLLDNLLKVAGMVSRTGALVGGVLLLLSTIMVSVEVVLRKVFAVSLGGADEISGYVLAVSSSWALAYALLHKAHVRVDALNVALPAPYRAGLDLVALLVLGVFSAVLSSQAVVVVRTSLERASTSVTPLQTPLWIPQGLWLLGLLWFSLTLLLLTARLVLALAQRDLSTAHDLAGARTLDDDLQIEPTGHGQSTAAHAGR